MKNPILTIFAFTFCMNSASAQETNILTSYDFWVGKWDLTWDDGADNIGKGTNNVVKTLDDKVIQENFEATEGQYRGMKGASISVYSARSKQWKQTWADNQGGYIELTGGLKDGDLTFETDKKEKGGIWSQSRMVFYNIKKDSFTWDWEGTKDSGKTWNLQWRINYTRVNQNTSD